MQRIAIVSVAVVAGLVLAGCSAPLPRIEEAGQIAERLRQEGMGCEDFITPDRAPSDRPEGIPDSSGSCAVRGEGVQIYGFPSDEDADLWFERGRMEYVSTARGPNWVVVTDSHELADKITELMSE